MTDPRRAQFFSFVRAFFEARAGALALSFEHRTQLRAVLEEAESQGRPRAVIMKQAAAALLAGSPFASRAAQLNTESDTAVVRWVRCAAEVASIRRRSISVEEAVSRWPPEALTHIAPAIDLMRSMERKACDALEAIERSMATLDDVSSLIRFDIASLEWTKALQAVEAIVEAVGKVSAPSAADEPPGSACRSA